MNTVSHKPGHCVPECNSLNCYEFYVMLENEPGVTVMTFEEWSA